MPPDKPRIPSACLVREPGSLAYPSGLYSLTPPPVVYLRGDSDVVQRPMVAIVGTRTPLAEWRAWAANLAGRLTERGFVVCSGFAPGIDRAAHRGALAAGGHTVAVLGEDVFDVRARGEREGISELLDETLRRGCLLSEQSPGGPRVKPRQTVARLILRNRIIAALSQGVVVAAAWEKGGAHMTANWAARLKRPVWTADFGQDTPIGNLRILLGGASPLPADACAAAEQVSLSLTSSCGSSALGREP